VATTKRDGGFPSSSPLVVGIGKESPLRRKKCAEGGVLPPYCHGSLLSFSLQPGETRPFLGGAGHDRLLPQSVLVGGGGEQTRAIRERRLWPGISTKTTMQSPTRSLFFRCSLESRP